jgi:hypothetical protein
MSCLRSSRSSHPGREAWTKPLSVLGPKAPEADVPLRPVLESTWRVRYAAIAAAPAAFAVPKTGRSFSLPG